MGTFICCKCGEAYNYQPDRCEGCGCEHDFTLLLGGRDDLLAALKEIKQIARLLTPDSATDALHVERIYELAAVAIAKQKGAA